MLRMPVSGSCGDAHGGGEVRRGVVAGRRNRHRQKFQAAVGLAQRVAFDDDLLARRRCDLDWRNRIGDGVHPGIADVLDRPPHADGIDFRRGRERADRDWRVVAAALAVGDVGKDERAPFVLPQAALKLPTHQRMQLGVLVDRPIDATEKTRRFEPRQMLLKVERRPARLPFGAVRIGLVEHDYFLFFMYSAMIGLAIRKQSTPFGAPQ